MNRHRVTPSDRRSGAPEVRVCFSIDEEDRVHTEGPAFKKNHRSLRVDGIVDRGSWIVDRGSWIVERVEQDRRAVGALVQHRQPGSMFMGLGTWRGTAATTR